MRFSFWALKSQCAQNALSSGLCPVSYYRGLQRSPEDSVSDDPVYIGRDTQSLPITPLNIYFRPSTSNFRFIPRSTGPFYTCPNLTA